ncbi:MAG TPA: hypothetical protein VGX50_17125 [Longimicrobium sp.]|jgi:hypothetical protein|nr:hypothetical protein [Longimicrobium sp.]
MFEQFPAGSRYHGVPVKTYTAPDGVSVAYLARRFIPPPERFSLLQEHVVSQGDRLDVLTARYLGDPEVFWRIADANNAMDPQALTREVGRRLRITLPEGIPGVPGHA